MNFSFDESGETGSKTHSEENLNLFYFLLRCSNTLLWYFVGFFLLKNND